MEKCTLFDLNYKPDKMSIEELRDGLRNLGVYIYGDEFTQWRKDRFREYLKTVIKEEREKNQSQITLLFNPQ